MVTRKDIADRLGVSVSVVSRALHNSGYVRKETREDILRLAGELGYGQAPAALRQTKLDSKRIAIYTANTRNPFYVEVDLGIQAALEHTGYSAVLCRPPFSDERSKLTSNGIIFMSDGLAYDYLTTDGRQDFRPAVSASFGGSRQLPRHVVMVECDLWDGTETLIRYLRGFGHKRIAMVSPLPMDDNDSRIRSWAASMQPVFGSELNRYYLEVSDATRAGFSQGNLVGGEKMSTVLTAEDFFENGVLAAELFAQSSSDATAVICFNEEMGIGFCKKLRRLGIRIPEEVSVVAYDGTYLRRYVDQTLTVLSLQPYLMGLTCARTLIRMLEGEKGRNCKITLKEILEGETVAAPCR